MLVVSPHDAVVDMARKTAQQVAVVRLDTIDLLLQSIDKLGEIHENDHRCQGISGEKGQWTEKGRGVLHLRAATHQGFTAHLGVRMPTTRRPITTIHMED